MRYDINHASCADIVHSENRRVSAESTAIPEQDGLISVEFKKTSVSKEPNGIDGCDGIKRVANGSDERIDSLSTCTPQTLLDFGNWV